MTNTSANNATNAESKRLLRLFNKTDEGTKEAVEKLLECTPRKRVLLSTEMENQTKPKSMDEIIQEMVTDGSLISQSTVVSMINDAKKEVLSTVSGEQDELQKEIEENMKDCQNTTEDVLYKLDDFKRTFDALKKIWEDRWVLVSPSAKDWPKRPEYENEY